MKINLSFQRQWKQDCQGIHCSPQQSQDWRFMKWRCQWQWPGRKVEPLPCSSLPLNWCHTTTTTLKFWQNLEWTRTNWKNQKKKDQTTFWCTLLKHICEIQLSMKPLAAVPQAAWDQAQETHPVLSWARNLQGPPRWQRGEAALFGTVVQVLFNSACGLSRFMYLPPLVSHSDFGASSRSDRVFGTFPPISWMQISSTAALTLMVSLHLGQQLLSMAHHLYRKWHPNKMVTNPLKFCLNMKRSDKVDEYIAHASGQWKGETSAFALVLTLVEFRILNRLSRKFPFASPKQTSHNANTCLSTAYSTKLFPSFHLAFKLSLTSDKSFI